MDIKERVAEFRYPKRHLFATFLATLNAILRRDAYASFGFGNVITWLIEFGR